MATVRQSSRHPRHAAGVAVAGAAVTALTLAACGAPTTNAINEPPKQSATATSSDVPITGLASPQVLAASGDGAALYIAQNDGTIKKINTPANTLGASWNSGVPNPLGLAISPDGATLYISNRAGNSVTKMNTTTGATVGSWSVGSGSSPTGIGISPDGALVYVPQNASAGIGADKLTVRAAGTGALQQTWTLPAGSRPRAVVISPDGSTAYVSMEAANRISVRKTSDGTETASWPLTATGFTTPGYLALSKKGDRLYLGAVTPTGVAALNTSDGAAVDKWTSGLSSVFGVTVANCSQTLFVANATDPGVVSAITQPNQCLPTPTPTPTTKLPSAPRKVGATSPAKSTIKVTWLPPVSPGSTPITGYTATAIQKEDKTRGTCSASATVLTCTMTKVKSSKEYQVTVTATNANGTGPASEIVTVTAK